MKKQKTEHTGSVFEKINNAYYSLTNAEKKAADYVTAHSHESQTMSISDLAAACEVAEATVSRFCRKLGYSGYNEFKLSVARDTAGRGIENSMLSGMVEPEDSFRDVCTKLFNAEIGAMRGTLEEANKESYRQAADILIAAKRVLFMGHGGSMIVATEAAHLFSTVGGKFYPVADSHLQAIAIATSEPDDAIVMFSYSGAIGEMLETMQFARKRGMKIILVTRFPKAPATKYADAVLLCGANESPLQLGSVAARISQLFLTDILFTEYCRRDLPSAKACRTRIAEALESKHLS